MLHQTKIKAQKFQKFRYLFFENINICQKYDFAPFCFWPMNFSLKTAETAAALQQIKNTQVIQLNNQNQKPSLPILINNIISGVGRPSFFFNANKCEWRVLNPILTSHPYFSLLWKPIHCNVSLSLQRILCKLLKMLLMSMNVPHELVTHKLSQKQQDKKKNL